MGSFSNFARLDEILVLILFSTQLSGVNNDVINRMQNLRNKNTNSMIDPRQTTKYVINNTVIRNDKLEFEIQYQ